MTLQLHNYIDVPEQPQNITAVEIQSRYLVLMWMEPHNNNAPILGYFVSYHQPVFAGGERIILTVSKEVVNVTNLLPGVIYNFTVIAYNDIGNSTASETIHLRTLEEGEYEVSHYSRVLLYSILLLCILSSCQSRS